MHASVDKDNGRWSMECPGGQGSYQVTNVICDLTAHLKHVHITTLQYKNGMFEMKTINRFFISCIPIITFTHHTKSTSYVPWSKHSWLVVSTILKNMSSSVGMMTFPIYEKIWNNNIHVPNHQPA